MATLTATNVPEGFEPPARKGFDPFPDGSKFHVEIVDVKEKKSTWKDKETGEHVALLNFHFKVIDGRWENRRFFGDPRAEFFPGSRLFNWVCALLNTEVQPGFTLNTDDLIGKKARITIAYRTWDKTDNTIGWTNDVKYLDPYDPTEQLAEPETMADPNAGGATTGGGTTLSYDQDEPF
jgi:hypothetical protein